MILYMNMYQADKRDEAAGIRWALRTKVCTESSISECSKETNLKGNLVSEAREINLLQPWFVF